MEYFIFKQNIYEFNTSRQGKIEKTLYTILPYDKKSYDLLKHLIKDFQDNNDCCGEVLSVKYLGIINDIESCITLCNLIDINLNVFSKRLDYDKLKVLYEKWMDPVDKKDINICEGDFDRNNNNYEYLRNVFEEQNIDDEKTSDKIIYTIPKYNPKELDYDPPMYRKLYPYWYDNYHFQDWLNTDLCDDGIQNFLED